jgi:hypothetical protein
MGAEPLHLAVSAKPAGRFVVGIHTGVLAAGSGRTYAISWPTRVCGTTSLFEGAAAMATVT